MKFWIIAAVCSGFAWAAVPAEAATVSFHGEGITDTIDPAISGIANGAPVTFDFTYTAGPPFVAALLSGSINGQAFSLEQAAAFVQDNTAGTDALLVEGANFVNPPELVPGFVMDDFLLTFHGPTTLFPAAELPAALILSMFDTAQFTLRFHPVGQNSPDLFVQGRITALATTPIPAALPLFASALGGMSLLAWRRRKSAIRGL